MEESEIRAEEPDKICVIVHGGKNLHSKKKGRCKFSVIFGVGSKKFRTDVIEDVFGSPVWNTEAEIDVDDASHPLILTVTEKDSVLGQVIIPLNELPTSKPYQGKKVSLQPHKKCPEPQGDIVLSAWISSFRAPRAPKSSPSGALKSLKKMKQKISQSPLLRRKSSTGTDLPVSAGMRGSASLGDLAGFGRKKSNLLSIPSDSLCSITSSDSDASSQHTTGSRDIRDDLRKPEVSGISPKEGPNTGGTRLTLRGINLGRNIDDIISLHICGADCTHTVEYESTSKIYVTTIPWKPGPGDVVIETASGGRGHSLVQFTFTGDGERISPLPTKRMSPLVTHRMSPLPANKKRFSLDASLLSTNSKSPRIIEEDEKPEVSGISPKEGSTEGDTRLTIRGQNLGLNAQDVVSVTVCGYDCTNTLEYESPRKIFVTTKPANPCSGDIIVQTKSGGRGTSTVKFTYVKPAEPPASTEVVGRNQVDLLTDIQHVSQGATLDDDDDDFLAPEVTGVSPAEGPANGGTRITLRGINLGENHDDIIGLTICGSDCLSTLEYVSPMKLHCTTSPGKPGSGKIVVETKKGGVGSSLVNFTFLKPAEPLVSASSGISNISPPPSKPPRKSIGRRDSKSPSSETESTDSRQVPEAGSISSQFSTSRVQMARKQQPSIIVTDVCEDESTDYPSDVTHSHDEVTSRASTMPFYSQTDSASPSSHTPVSSSDSFSHNVSSKTRTPEGSESRPQPVGQEKKSSPVKERKRPAPAPPGENPVSSARQQIQETIISDVYHDDSNQVNSEHSDGIKQDGGWKKTSDDSKKDSSFMSEITAQDMSEKFIKDYQQQEREVQSGPTRQELMEEIRRVKLENRQLHEQNLMMKQYLERLLSEVMIHCPEVLCIDAVHRHGNY